MTRKRYFVLQGMVGILAFLSVLLVRCTGKDEGFGKELLPEGDMLYSRIYTETDSISAYTVPEEKVLVSNPSSLIFGSFNDPLLGRTDAGFAAQFRLVADPGFDEYDQVDSVVLVMTYKEIYGDTLTPQTVNVYKLADEHPLNPYARYYSPGTYDLRTWTDGSGPIGSKTFVPKFRLNYTVQDSVETVSDTIKQVIRIKLGNELGNTLVKADTTIYDSNDNFLNFFKGLYIEPDSVASRGTLMKLFPYESKVLIYYRDSALESSLRYIAVTSNSAVVPRFSHNFDNSALKVYMSDDEISSSSEQDSLLFIKPNAGTRVKVMVPTLDKWAEPDSSGCMINKALITFHVDTLKSDLRRFTNPESLYLMRIGEEDGKPIEEILEDAKLGISYYGGVYDAENATYSFNIAQHLQGIIKGDIENTGFYLVHATRRNSFGRVILKGQGSSEPIKLEISYSRFSN